MAKKLSLEEALRKRSELVPEMEIGTVILGVVEGNSTSSDRADSYYVPPPKKQFTIYKPNLIIPVYTNKTLVNYAFPSVPDIVWVSEKGSGVGMSFLDGSTLTPEVEKEVLLGLRNLPILLENASFLEQVSGFFGREFSIQHQDSYIVKMKDHRREIKRITKHSIDALLSLRPTDTVDNLRNSSYKALS